MEVVDDEEIRNRTELLVKLGISLCRRAPSDATCGDHVGPSRTGTQAWSTFVRNHARDVLASDFFVTVTVRLRLIYVLIVLDIGTRRLLHWNVTEHPTAAWVVQQFRTCTTGESTHRFVVHDRDSIYSKGVDLALRAMALRVLKTVAVPQADRERVIGTARRECLDWVNPLNERHLRRVLAEWVPHYNPGRPHSQLGPGIPDSIDHRSTVSRPSAFQRASCCRKAHLGRSSPRVPD